MSADGFIATSSSELTEAVLAVLREDAAIKTVLGDPPRLFDDETNRASFPYAVLERHETTDTSSSQSCSLEHRFQFATYSRYGGMSEAKSVLGTLRTALESLQLTFSTQRVILSIPTYCDVMRTQNQQIFRGVLRVRIHTEEI